MKLLNNIDSFPWQLSLVQNTSPLILTPISRISLIISGVGVMNMMYSSVSERKFEIGVKRALRDRK